MKLLKVLSLPLFLFAGTQPSIALAGPGESSVAGSTSARIVEPLDIQSLRDLRFGAFVQPTTAGTVTVTATGNIATTGGLDPSINSPARGAATFLVHGTGNRMFITFLPNQATITNGSATMTVDQFRKNNGILPNRIDPNGYYLLNVGARLNVSANQPVGQYSGTFTVTVLYL